jgi:NAD(P)-dependent dehydrogenase (short-subunit alcohol dehydrogenase family)
MHRPNQTIRGLGLEMVRAFAARGADVIIASRKIDNCEKAADEVPWDGAGWRSAHVANWAEIDRLEYP